MEEEFDEFGIPIKKESATVQQTEVDEFGIPVKKKEATVSVSPSVEAGSASVGSDIEPTPSPVPTISDIPDQPVDEPIAALYESYKGAGKIKPAQQQIIEAKIRAQEKGDRGFWETAIALTEGYFKTGMAIPMFQYDNKEDLLAKRELKNKVDFLSELPEETLLELKSYAGEKIADLESSNLNVLAENKIMEEGSKQLVNELKYQTQAIQQLRESGQDVPEEGIKAYEDNRLELQSLAATYNNNVDSLENNNEDIGDFYEEVNLLKKNYGGLDYYKDMARLTSAGMMAGAAEFALSTRDMVSDHPLAFQPFGAPFEKEDVAEFRAEVDSQQEYLRPQMSVSDIEGMGDFGAWLGEQVATQLPVITVLAASGGTVGLGALGVSAAGQKIGELEDRRADAKQTIESMNSLLSSGQEFTEEELEDIDGAISEATRLSDLSDDEMYLAGLGTGALEVLTERVTLGILSKGKRAFLAAKNAGGAPFKEFGKGVGRSVTAGMSEGGAEFVNQIGQNTIDILYLNDPDVHIFDGAVDALASGSALGFGMRFSPMVMGMGSKAFMPKESTTKIKADTKKISDLIEEAESNEQLDSETKKQINNKIKTLKEEVSKGMKKTFDDVSKMPKENISELIELDKKANKIAKRVQELQSSNVNKELKAEFILDLKRDIDAIAARKKELLDSKEGKSLEEIVDSPLKKELKGIGATQKIIDAIPDDTVLREGFLADTSSLSQTLESVFMGLAGNYSQSENTVRVGKFYSSLAGGRDRILLHEAVHAATVSTMRDVSRNPDSYAQQQVESVRELSQIAGEYMMSTSSLSKMLDPRVYGTLDRYEFVSEFLTNKKFREWVGKNDPRKDMDSVTGTPKEKSTIKHIWSRILEALGMSKKDIDQSIIDYVEVLIDKTLDISIQRNGIKQKSKGESSGANAGIFEGSTGTVEEGQDSGQSTVTDRPRVKLSKQSKGIYMDTINDYTVNKTDSGKWQVRTAPDSKNNNEGTVLTEVATLKEATAYLQEQTDKRAELLESAQREADSGNLFDNKEGKSEFNWRKLLSGVPVVSYVDEITFSRMAKVIEDKISYYGNKAFLGQYNIKRDDSSPSNLNQREAKALKNFGIEVVNSLVVGSANVANSFYKGYLRTDSEIASSRKVEGYQKRTLTDAKSLTLKLGMMIDSDPASAKRVHQALDPEIYDETVRYEDLTEGEKTLYDSLRAINQATHELNYKNGFISKETFDKYDGKYIGRGYEVYEDGLSSTDREIAVSSKFFGDIYKQRQEINQWLMDNTVSDPIYLTMNRMVRSQRNVIVKDYSNFVSKKYGVRQKPESGVYTQLNGKSYGDLNGKWIPSNVAEDFKGYFFNNSILDSVYQGLNIYNQTLYKQFMKRFHTVYSPLVQVGNFVSNLAFSYAAGVNFVQLGKNIGPSYTDLKNKTGDYQAVMQEGIIGSNVLEKDLQLSKEAKSNLSMSSQSKIMKLDSFARRAYSASDNVMKLAAYKSLREVGYNHEESVQRVYEGFQNYASVGKVWDIFSKVPVWGSDYIKFQGDLNRIVKNAVTKRPLTSATFLYSLSLVAGILSRLSGESEEERAIREGRQYIPKIKTFIGDFPLTYRAGDTEVNMARYISPLYEYDTGSKHWAERVAKYSPINLNVDEATGAIRIIPSDVALGSIWAAFMDNKDFRNKIISDPDYNIYTGSTASEGQKLSNRVLYVLRSQVPLFSFGNDLALSAAFGEDYYGRTKDPAQVLASRIVKIQTWDDDSTRDQIVRSLSGIDYRAKALKTQRSAIGNKYDKRVYELEDKLRDGKITQVKFDNSVKSAAEDYEKRSAALAEKEALLQEEFNTLDENVKSIGLNFKSILDKAD
jgi:hypothetical protein